MDKQDPFNPNAKHELAYYIMLIQENLGTDDLVVRLTLSEFLDAVATLPSCFDCKEMP